MPIDLDNSFGFLIADIGRLLRERFNVTAQSVGLTLAQARALIRLSGEEGISQTVLAQKLEIQPITLLRQIDRLEDAGLVERCQNPSDRRAQQLYLTAQALPLLEDIATLSSGLTDAALQGLSGPERDTMIRLLHKVRTNVTAWQPAADSETGT